jgi:histidine triad (HIT) family protein
MPCLICDIVQRRVPSHVVYEDADTVAFLDIRPVARGHTLLVPRAHAARVEDLTPGQSEALFRALHAVLAPIRDAVSADATTIGVNNGPGSGQEIQHVHIHIIPRRRGDRGGIVQRLGPGGAGDPDETAAAIRAAVTKRP